MQTALSRLNEEERKEYWACLALKYAPKIGKKTIAKAVQHFDSAYAAVQRVGEWSNVRGLSGKSHGIENDAWRKMAASEWENARDLDAHIILWTSDLYPPLLKEIPEAPAFFYAYGNLNLLKKPCIAIVGSRTCTLTGAKMADYVATALSLCGFTIVSGMARGVDRNAHIGALKHASMSIGVLGSGIDIAYPDINSDLYKSMRNHGLLISEFAPGTIPDPRNFPERNRIISGLSQGVVVIEAARKSGSGITAYTANEQGRNVFAVPGAIGEDNSLGCQQLIRYGAKPVFNAEDILEDFLPLIDAKALEIDALLKKHALSAENIFGHRSVLNPDADDKKRRMKKLYTQPLIATQAEEIQEKEAHKSEIIEKNTLFKDIEKLEKKINTENARPQASQKQPSTLIRSYKEWYSPDMLEYKVLEFVFDEHKQFDEICQHIGVNAQELGVCLVKLELIDRITRYEGSWFGRYE